MRMRQAIGFSLALFAVSSAASIAAEPEPGRQHPVPSLKAKPGKSAAAAAKPAVSRPVAGRGAQRSSHRSSVHAHAAHRAAAQLPPPDEYVGAMRVVGRREVGAAAWYGGRHLGQPTASGGRLDAVHATAAHRSLPLMSLVRVTNLSNGRSVIAKITDRGPVSPKLVIDVSPRAAAELRMMDAGIVKVAIEQVVPEANPPHRQEVANR